MSISQRLEILFRQSVSNLTPLAGGCVAEVYAVDLADRRQLVVKFGRGLDLEGRMLTHLADHTHVPVPEVIHCAADLLVMSRLPSGGSLGPAAQVHAADLIAGLHAITAPFYGFAYDTVIGGLHQPTPQTATWIDFFRQHRLMFMADHANKINRLPLNTLARIERFAATLDDRLIEPAAPSLIHGDLWAGNILCFDNKITGLIDPALYFANAEIELAFGALFATFDQTFYDRYREQRPIAPGFFEERLEIYNLYPLLVHVSLFGGSYVSQIERTLTRFGY